MKFKNCLKCGKSVSKNCKLGYCTKCRNRSGDKNPFYGKKHDRTMIENTKNKLSIISKNNWKDEDYRAKVIKGVSKPRREGFKKEQSERVTKWYVDNPEQKDIRKIKMKETWASGKIEPNINSINESKLEREFTSLVINKLPNRNVRKATIKIENRWFYPDIRIDKNIIVEFYGNYWHANPKMFNQDDIVHHHLISKQIWQRDQERIDILKNNGFKIFIIWQDEYQNNKRQVIKKLINEIRMEDNMKSKAQKEAIATQTVKTTSNYSGITIAVFILTFTGAILKLTHIVNWQWWQVFLPVIIMCGFTLLVILLYIIFLITIARSK